MTGTKKLTPAKTLPKNAALIRAAAHLAALDCQKYAAQRRATSPQEQTR